MAFCRSVRGSVRRSSPPPWERSPALRPVGAGAMDRCAAELPLPGRSITPGEKLLRLMGKWLAAHEAAAVIPPAPAAAARRAGASDPPGDVAAHTPSEPGLLRREGVRGGRKLGRNLTPSP